MRMRMRSLCMRAVNLPGSRGLSPFDALVREPFNVRTDTGGRQQAATVFEHHSLHWPGAWMTKASSCNTTIAQVARLRLKHTKCESPTRCPTPVDSGRQSAHSDGWENERKSLLGQEAPQTASGRHTCAPSGGLRNSGHFPGVQGLTIPLP